MLKLLEALNARRLASVDSLRTLATLYKGARRLQEARDTLEKVAQLEPTSVANLLDLARVANEQNDNTGALGYLAHARELDPNNASVHFFWGIVCWEEHLGEEAYQSLKKAVTLDPNNAYYNYAIGVVTMQRGDGSESVTHLQKYCLLKPHDPRGKLAMGAAYFLSHQEEQAEKTLQHLTNDANTAAVANFYLARIAQHQGKPPEALEHIRLALQARPDYADAYAERLTPLLVSRDLEGHSGAMFDRKGQAILPSPKLTDSSYVNAFITGSEALVAARANVRVSS